MVMYETMYKIPFLFVLSTTLKCLLIAGSLQTSSVVYGVLKEQAGLEMGLSRNTSRRVILESNARNAGQRYAQHFNHKSSIVGFIGAYISASIAGSSSRDSVPCHDGDKRQGSRSNHKQAVRNPIWQDTCLSRVQDLGV